jgi:chromosome segregation ATPase
VLQAQREALQLRLAVDEAWSQLSSSLPGVRLTHSLAESRRRLADQYRLQSEDLAEQRQQLRHLAEQLSVQRVQLQQQRRQLQQWLDQRLAELDARQAELLESEQALAARRHEIDQIIARWEAQRKTTHEQFKRVLAEIQRT